MEFRNIVPLIVSVCFLSCVLSCDGNPLEPTRPPFTSKDLRDRGGETAAQLAASLNDPSVMDCGVAPIENIAAFPREYLDGYILGVDLSSIIEVESLGGAFYDIDRYRVGDVIELFSYYGINWIRMRLWNEPFTAEGASYGGGGNDIQTALAIGRRAKKWGMKILLDFHYSDFWAHPGQQARPKDWVQYLTADALAPVFKNWTKGVLYAMNGEGGFLPDMVQIGNETVAGFCGFHDDGPLATTKPNEKKLLAAGLEAVREISEECDYPILTMLHAANDMVTIDRYIGIVQDLDFDVIGFSYYPDSYGNRADFEAGLQNLANKYQKPICLAEYQVPFTGKSAYDGSFYNDSNANTASFIDTGASRTVSGQAQIIRNMNNAIMNNTVSGGVRYGIGSFWWEAAWLPLDGTGWKSANSNEWYRMNLPGKPAITEDWLDYPARVGCADKGFFSFNGTALPSLNAFLQMMGKDPRPNS